MDDTQHMESVEPPRRHRKGAIATVAAAVALFALGALLIAANLNNTPTGQNPGQPPAVPASNQPSTAPVETQQVRRPTATPTRTQAPSPARPTPTPTQATTSPTPDPPQTSAPAQTSSPAPAVSPR